MGGSGACHSGRVGVGSGSGRRLAGVPATGRPDGYVPTSRSAPGAGRRRRQMSIGSVAAAAISAKIIFELWHYCHL
jgi:hypothetical protein